MSKKLAPADFHKKAAFLYTNRNLENYDKIMVSIAYTIHNLHYCPMLYFDNNSLKAFSSADSFTLFSAPSILAVA